jgi:glycosyltransferase involved in cell wall biosynthesis
VPQSHFDGTNVDLRILDKWRPVIDGDVPDADAIIATWWETAEWVNEMAPSKGAKVYFIQHHEIFSHLPIERCHRTYRMPFHKIVVAEWLRDVMQNEYGDQTTVVVPNSVDRKQFFAPSRSKQVVPTIGFLYHPIGFKGVDCVLSAIEQIKRRLPDLRVVCFGASAPLYPLPSYIEFVCNPLQNELRNIYSRCDVWMTASRTEGFNLPALEAMACRTPVVSTRTGWPAEAIQDGYNGFLVEIEDVGALADRSEGILKLASSEWEAMSANAHRTSSKGSWDESTSQFEAALYAANAKSLVI